MHISEEAKSKGLIDNTFLELNDNEYTRYPVTDILMDSITAIVCDKENSLSSSPSSFHGRLYINNVLRYSGIMHLDKRSTPEQQGNEVVVMLHNKLPPPTFDGVEELAAATLSNISPIRANYAVTDDYRALVADLLVSLNLIQTQLNALEIELRESTKSEESLAVSLEYAVSYSMRVHEKDLQEIIKPLSDITAAFSYEQHVEHKRFFRDAVGDVVAATPFVNRSIEKPLGYSGDYKMMLMLYDYQDIGESLFHQFFHRFVCSQPTAMANRNRIQYLSAVLRKKYAEAKQRGQNTFNISSIACGPAREIYEFVKHIEFDSECVVNIRLLDLEEKALGFAEQSFSELDIVGKGVNISYIKTDAVVACLRETDDLSTIDDTDCLISAGLFDYLTERVSRKMISVFCNRLRPNGSLLIGNINTTSPDIFSMGYFMDWELILRTPEDLLNLVDPESINKAVTATVDAEPIGLNLFLRVDC